MFFIPLFRVSLFWASRAHGHGVTWGPARCFLDGKMMFGEAWLGNQLRMYMCALCVRRATFVCASVMCDVWAPAYWFWPYKYTAVSGIAGKILYFELTSSLIWFQQISILAKDFMSHSIIHHVLIMSYYVSYYHSCTHYVILCLMYSLCTYIRSHVLISYSYHHIGIICYTSLHVLISYSYHLLIMYSFMYGRCISDTYIGDAMWDGSVYGPLMDS